MLKNFYYQDISFKKYALSDMAVMMGEITNNTGTSYNAVVFRIILFSNKNIPIGHAMLTINGFVNGQTKLFEKQLPGFEYKDVNKIYRWEICAETAY